MDCATLMLWCLLIPAGGALLIAASSQLPNLREGITLLTAASLLATVVALLRHPQALQTPALILTTPFGGLQFELRAEPLGLLFATIASLLWLITAVYTIGYMRANHESHQTRLYVCFALAISSTLGIALAGNLPTLFLFYELLTLSTYPLVTHKGDHDAVSGGRYYLGILISSSMGLLLPAIIWTNQLAGTSRFVAGGILPADLGGVSLVLLLLLYAFGIGKAALVPLHRWLPEAMVAPTPVSALLHAVAVVKAGVFCLVKVLLYVFGPQLLRDSAAQQLLLALAAGTILYASLKALQQDNLKRRLAYSTVSQLSYVILAAALLSPASIRAAALHIAAHAAGKISLFFAAGAIYTAAHKSRVSELDGLGRRMPLTFVAFAIASLSMIGLPPAAGFVSKWYLLQAVAGQQLWWLAAVLLASSLLNAAYFVPIVHRAFWRPEAKPPHQPHGEAPWPMTLALSLTASLCLLLFFWPDLPLKLAHLLPGVTP
ncbi:MAG: proton-conducting transporter membrane subunit [Desulfuromonas sp.]